MTELKQRLKEEKDHLINIQAKLAVSSGIMSGFFSASEELCEERIEIIKRKIRLSKPPKEGSVILTQDDIWRAKQVPILNLIKVPRNKKVNCLFHSDSNASMHIYPNNYYCFSCQASGSVVDIVMKLQGYSFTQAVRYLINK